SSSLLSTVRDPDDNGVSYTYSGGQLTTIQTGYFDVSNNFHGVATTSIAYDGSNNVTLVTDAVGDTRTFAYDSSHKLTSDSDPMSFAYTAGAVSSITRGSGLGTSNVTPQLYVGADANHGVGVNPTVGYDGNFAASIVDGNSHTATHQMDDHGRLLKVTLPSGAST